MKRFRKLLVYVDADAESQPALERAVDLASHSHAELTLMTSLPTIPWHLQDGLPRSIIAEQADACSQRLESLAEPARNRGLHVSTRVLQDHADVELVREVLRGEHDLLLKTAGSGVTRRGMFHSTLDQRLMRRCPCPVWLFPVDTPPRFSRILAAVDATPDDSGHALLNQTVLELSSLLQGSEQAELHVVHAWSIPDEARLHARLGDRVFRAAEQHSRDMVDEELNRLLARHAVSASPDCIHAVKGEPEAVILELLDRMQIDLLVMGSLARTGLSGVFIGNTAERVLAEVHCSVLTVKPPGFISPVTLN